MVNQEYYTLGTAPSVIRQLFAYGLEQAKVVGPENVYDYSLGNPSIPAPKKVNESIKKIVDETDSIKLHGYSMAPGFEEARAAVAKDLAARFGLDVKASELFFTCRRRSRSDLHHQGADRGRRHRDHGHRPLLPRVSPLRQCQRRQAGGRSCGYQGVPDHLDEVEKRITKHTQAIIVNSPTTPPALCTPRRP